MVLRLMHTIASSSCNACMLLSAAHVVLLLLVPDKTETINMEANTAYATTSSVLIEANAAYVSTPCVPVEADYISIPVKNNDVYLPSPNIPVEANAAYDIVHHKL